MKTILLPLVVLVVYAFPVAAQDASDAAIQSKIVALEKAWNQAASGVMRVKGVENGRAYTRREQFVDTWLFKGGKWVCIATDATPIVH